MEQDVKIKLNSGSVIICNISYPEENPNGAVEDIARAMEYIGLFDGVERLPQIDK